MGRGLVGGAVVGNSGAIGYGRKSNPVPDWLFCDLSVESQCRGMMCLVCFGGLRRIVR